MVLREFVWEKLLEGKDLNCCQILHSNAIQTSNLAVLLIFVPALFLSKYQVSHLRVGRSCEQVLQRAYSDLISTDHSQNK